MKFKILNDLAIFFDNNVPEKYLSILQEFLLSGAIFTEASKVLAMLIIVITISEIALTLTIIIMNLPVSILILPFFCYSWTFYIYYCPAREKSTGN